MTTAIALDHGLTIKDVEAAHGRLTTALTAASLAGTGLVVDVGNTVVIDSAGVQLLLALECDAAARSVTLTYRGESAALDRAFTRLGLRRP